MAEFKSWKEEFTSKDVKKFLEENDIDNIVYDGICGDGDITFLSKNSALAVYDLGELVKLKEIFGAKSLMIEPYEHGLGEPIHILITLSWNE